MNASQLVAGIAQGVWISGIVTLIAAFSIRALGRVMPPARMRVWWLCFLLAITLPLGLALWAPAIESVRQIGSGREVVQESGPHTVVRDRSLVYADVRAINEAPRADRVGQRLAETFEPQLGPTAVVDVTTREETIPVVRGPIVPEGSWGAIVLAIVVVTGLVRVLWIGVGLARMAVHKSAARPLLELNDEWQAALRALGTRRRALLLESAAIVTPIQAGYFRPAVLVPPGLFDHLTAAERRHVLMHEAAHILRRDDWLLLFQRIAEAVIWFHPAVWWLARRLDLDRESLCDRMVARRSGSRRYARTLVRLAEFYGANTVSHLTPALAPNTSRLARRVAELLGAVPRARQSMRVAFGAAIPCAAMMAAAISPLRTATPPTASTDPVTVRSGSTGTVLAGLGAQLDSLLTAYEHNGFSGTILLAHHGVIVLEKGYGLADHERRIPASAATRYGLAGFTKSFTAAAVLELVEQGRLSLHDSIGQYLPELTGSKRNVTIHQLLTHTDGMTRLAAPIFRSDANAFLRALDQTPAQFAPGQGYRYNDFGHSVLGIVIERLTGQSYESYVRSNFIEPLGLGIGFEPDGDAIAVEYQGNAQSLSPIPARSYTWGRRGSLGMTGTARDAYHWLLALDSATVISPSVRRQMLTPQGTTDYGSWLTYGWELYARGTRNGTLLRRVAGTPGMEGEILHDPNAAWSAVILTNSRIDWRFRVWSAITRLTAD